MKSIYLTALFALAAVVPAHAQFEDMANFRNPLSLPLRTPDKANHHPGPANNDASELQESRYTQKDDQRVYHSTPVSLSTIISLTEAMTPAPATEDSTPEQHGPDATGSVAEPIPTEGYPTPDPNDLLKPVF